MIVYITKYALTEGIKPIEVDKEQIRIYGELDTAYGYFNTKDYALTEEGAIEKAETMRLNRIKSMEKKLKRLKNMSFKKQGVV